MTDLKKLRKLAEMATPGPWTGYNRGVFSMASPISNQGYGGNVCAVDMQKDFEFIKAANPQAIIELLDRLERYEKALEKIATGTVWNKDKTFSVGIGADPMSRIAIEALEDGK